MTIIFSTGSYLPKRIITNDELAKTIDTSDEWITTRTGIKQRHIADESENCSDLAFYAAREVLANAIKIGSNIKAEDIEMIIVATTTPDLVFPSTATKVQAMLGAHRAFAFDIQAVCAGFVYAVTTAHQFIANKTVKNVLVIGADILSRIVNWEDRSTSVLFGDGAGAVLLLAQDSYYLPDDWNGGSGIIATDLHSDGRLRNILKTEQSPVGHRIVMEGSEVFRHAAEKMADSLLAALEKTGLKVSDIDLLIPHQANIRILQAVAKKLRLPDEKVVITVDQHANTSAASIPLALNAALQQGRIKRGDLLAFEALGGGLTWGSILARW